MTLLDMPADSTKNILPQDGLVLYLGKLYTTTEANHLLQLLTHEIAWRHDELMMFGKHITTKRKVAWHGEKAYRYTYSNSTKLAAPWTDTLLSIKNKVEKASGDTFNCCLLNFYHHGNEGMSWHSDDEKELKKDGAIASVSFGAERKFSFKHKTTQEKVELILEHGSLLMMKGTTQRHWLHRLPPTKRISTPRINLTFRTILDS